MNSKSTQLGVRVTGMDGRRFTVDHCVAGLLGLPRDQEFSIKRDVNGGYWVGRRGDHVRVYDLEPRGWEQGTPTVYPVVSWCHAGFEAITGFVLADGELARVSL